MPTMARIALFVIFSSAIDSPCFAQQSVENTKNNSAFKTILEQIAGTWVFDEATLGKSKQSQTGRVWNSHITIQGDSFTLTKYMDAKDLKGTIVLDPANPTFVDLKIQELDMSDKGFKVKIPAGNLQAIFELKNDRLILCFPFYYENKRPITLEHTNNVYRVELVRAPTGFTDFPKDVEVQVVGPVNKPAAGVPVAGFMSVTVDSEKKDVIPPWEYFQSTKTDKNGVLRVKYQDCRTGSLLVRDEENRRMAVISTSPAKLMLGEVKATLVPECHITGKIISDELAKLGKPVEWTGTFLMLDGKRIAFYSSADGRFEFFAPPGEYTLSAYGSDIESKSKTITVPPDRSELVVDPIAIPATALALLKGQPAPEFAGLLGWKGDPVKLSDLKGKYVVVEFWGYWCGPCVASMPVLIELHEKYAHKGLAIVGVHMDLGGEVDTAAKLDEKIATTIKERWNGKAMPFPNALASGKRLGDGDRPRPGGPIAQYGIEGFPTTILIDRDGKVVGQFHTRDIKKASEEIEKLLEKK